MRPTLLLLLGAAANGADAAAAPQGHREGGAAKLGAKVWTLGPFASGKVEYDGDPLVPLGGIQVLYRSGPASSTPEATWPSFLAEHAAGGLVRWTSAQAKQSEDGASHVTLPFSHVPFQELMSHPPLGGASDVLHVQHWAVWPLKVARPGRFSVDCKGLHTFEITGGSGETRTSTGPLAGNIYSASADLYAASVDLPSKGTYQIYARVRGQVPLAFSCALRPLPPSSSGLSIRAEVHSKNLPDIVLGRLIAGPSPLDLRVRNLGSSWVRVQASVKQPTGAEAGVEVRGAAAVVQLAPGMVAQVPVNVTVAGPAVEKEAGSCARFRLLVLATALGDGGGKEEKEVAVSLRCRKSQQSALMSFFDADGSVGLAAVLWPRGGAAESLATGAAQKLPIVVSLSGVGVEPQGQADAYKMKPTPDHKGEYIFGYPGLWVLAPQRGGPHNWEDVGIRTMLRAIEALSAAPVTPPADPDQLVVHGHSRGGHGAWGLATRIPDRVLGVMSACGWYSREEYGDANNLWVHETSLMHMDKVLLGLLQASVAENENSLHASNLRGIPALVRVGTRDRAVPPWFGRRMARHLREEGVNVTFQEFDKEHWWWDSKKDNDGGVMHDPEVRAWTQSVVEAGRRPLEEVLRGGELVISASSPEYSGRFGLRIVHRTSPSARAFLRVRWQQLPGGGNGLLEVRTANVDRFRLAPDSELGRAAAGEILVDGEQLQFDVGLGAEFCRARLRQDGVPTGSSEGICSAADGRCPGPAGPAADFGGRWQRCASSLGGPPLPRDGSLLGPIRRVFAAQWAVVVPDSPSPSEVRLATYFATGHLVAVDTATQVLAYSDALSLRASHRFVWLGGAHRFPPSVWSAWPVRVLVPGEEEVPEDVALTSAGWPTLSLGPCLFPSGKGHGAAFLAPAAAREAAAPLLDLVVTATDPKALEDLVSFSFATKQAHTRAPMSNMLPDFFVTGPDFRWRGYGGVVAAGYWDADWKVAPNSAVFQC